MGDGIMIRFLVRGLKKEGHCDSLSLRKAAGIENEINIAFKPWFCV